MKEPQAHLKSPALGRREQEREPGPGMEHGRLLDRDQGLAAEHDGGSRAGARP